MFMLLGFIFIGLGVYMFVDPSLSLLNQFPTLPFSTMWPPLVFGGGLVFLSVLGCCGAGSISDEKGRGCKFGIVTYMIICVILFIAQTGVLIWILSMMGVIDVSKVGISNNEQDAFAQQVEKTVTDFVKLDDDNMEAWYKVEGYLNCCGYSSSNTTKDDLAKNCPDEVPRPASPCEPAIFDFLESTGVKGIGVTAAVMAIQLVAITSACCLMFHKPNKQQKEAQKLDDNLNPYYG